MDKHGLDAEFAYLEYEDYEKSGSEDDFNTWKLKKYVDERIMQVVIGIAVGIITMFLLLKFT